MINDCAKIYNKSNQLIATIYYDKEIQATVYKDGHLCYYSSELGLLERCEVLELSSEFLEKFKCKYKIVIE